MNWRITLWTVFICCIGFLVWQNQQKKRERREQARESLRAALESLPEHVKFLMDISKHVFARFEMVDFEGLTEAEQTFFGVWSLTGLVNNDGFEGHFYGICAPYSIQAAEAFQRIGALKKADIVRRANAVFSDTGIPKDWDARTEIVDALPESKQEYLMQLDIEFYDCDEDYEYLLYKFVNEHRNDFLEAPADAIIRKPKQTFP